MKRVKLIGYINLFGRNSGFSFPVFEDNKVWILQEKNIFMKASKDLLKSPYFYMFGNKCQKDLQFAPEKTYHSIFVYNDGNNYLLYTNHNLLELKRLLKEDKLSEAEKHEINQFFIKRRIFCLNGRIKNADFDGSNNELSNSLTKDDIICCQNYAVNYSLSFDLKIYEFFSSKKDKILIAIGDQDNYMFVLFTLLRFQTLSIEDLCHLELISLQKNGFKDKKVHLAIFLLALKNNYIRVLYQYFEEDINKSTKYAESLLKLVFEYFNNQITNQYLDITIYIDKLCYFLETWYESVYINDEITINGYDYGFKTIKNNLPNSFNESFVVLMRKVIDGLLLEFKSTDNGYKKYMEKRSELQETINSCYEG